MIKSLNNSEIRPKKILDQIFVAYKNDLKILRSQKLVQTKCPACNSDKNQHFLTKMMPEQILTTKQLLFVLAQNAIQEKL